MFLEILIAILLGVAAGIFTGLTPGVHVNLLSSLLLVNVGLFSIFFLPFQLVVFIVSMSVTHTFIDSIPSVFLGAPDSSMALGVLPGHRYLLLGLGSLAVQLTIIGSLLSIVFSLIFFIGFYYLALTYDFWNYYIPYLLFGLMLFIFFQDQKKWQALLVIVISGLLGYFLLVKGTFDNPLFPLFSGLYGLSTLIYSIKEKNVLPLQKIVPLNVSTTLCLKSSVSSVFAGGLTSLLPGIGSGIAAVIAQLFVPKIGDKGFMILLGGANTANFVLSLAVWLAINKARNGSVIALQSLISPQNNLLLIIGTVLFTAGIAAITASYLSKKAVFIFRINYQLLSIIVILLIIFLVILLNGFVGLIILFTATAVGLLPAILKCRRSHAMSVLIVPVIIFML